MKKKIFIAALICALLTLCACSSSRSVWGKYTAEGNGTYARSSVEFAYSKTFYIPDIDAWESEKDENENDALLEGWYETDGDRVVCTYTDTSETDDDIKKITLVFTYDSENNRLISEDGRVFYGGKSNE